MKYNLSPNLLYFLDSTRSKIKPTAIINADAERMIAHSKGLIDDDGKLTPTAMVVLNDFETFLVKTKKKVTSDVLGDNFLENIKIYREIFPTGFLPHGEIARQSVEELKLKFIWFFKTYTDFTWPLIHEATNYYKYLKSKDGFKFMATSSYFIQKTDPKTKMVKSTLADYCQLLQDDPDIIHREVSVNQ
jgi:hypothetical protein